MNDDLMVYPNCKIIQTVGCFNPLESLTFGSLPLFSCSHFNHSLLSIQKERLILAHFPIRLLRKREGIRMRVLEQVHLLKYFQSKCVCNLDLKSSKLYFIYTLGPDILLFPDCCQRCRNSYCTK